MCGISFLHLTVPYWLNRVARGFNPAQVKQAR